MSQNFCYDYCHACVSVLELVDLVMISTLAGPVCHIINSADKRAMNCTSEHARAALLSLAWITLSACTVVLNKYILSNTTGTFIFTLALCHMLTCTLMCRLTFAFAPHMNSVSKPEPTLTGRLTAIGFLFVLSLVASNAALLRLDVATVQMIKSLNPAAMYVSGLMAGLERLALPLCGSLAVMCSGVMFAVQGVILFQPLGCVFQLLSMISDCARYILLQSILQSAQGINSLDLLYMVAPIAGVFLTFACAFFEFGQFESHVEVLRENLFLLLASSIIAYALNLCSYSYINATSALTMSVTGIVKDVALISISCRVLGASCSLHQIAGFGVAICGTIVYAHRRG